MSDFIPNHLSFNKQGFMSEFISCVNIALDRLSEDVQTLMKQEIMTNGNGSVPMKNTACQQVKELSRTIAGTQIELVIGIDEDSLGGFTDQVFVRTMVVLHGNVTSGPLRTKPGQMTWVKHASYMHMSPAENEDGTPRKSKIMPAGMMQFEKANGFGARRHMLDNIFDKQINRAVKDFYGSLENLLDSIDYSAYVIVG